MEEEKVICCINKCLYNLEYCCYKRPDNITPSLSACENTCAEYKAGEKNEPR